MPGVPTGEAAPASTPESSRDDAIMGVRGAEQDHRRGGARGSAEDRRHVLPAQPRPPPGEGQTPDEWALSAPSLLDVFLDARPNDRVRGFVLGRMFFDPTLRPGGAPPATVQAGVSQSTGGSMGSADLNSLFARRRRAGRTALLDQMWLRFDVARTVFVTAGKQHVRWGTGRFWSPTDFLHVRRRDPLAVFDARTGTTMVKLHMPWEAQGWNFYAYGLLEDAGAHPHRRTDRGAGRAEIVFGTTEVGLGAPGPERPQAEAGGGRLDRHLGPGLLRRAGPALRQRDRPGR